MSLALYRRYRPESFAEVIGQEHVTGPLQQALRSDRVNHAYLFSGPRGCGKTTSARILARALNCEQGPTPEPCGVCQSCQDLARAGAGSLDVVEIDAASHGGVDDARDLRERAFYAPASSRYKIYIIDEAHMVTPQGFNALLKVVEEPPPHLKFIFATTEPERVLGTIRSRTHHYPFRLVPPKVLQDYLAHLCAIEGVTVGPGVLPMVVRAGAGSVRDALSVLDQLIGGAGTDGVTHAYAASLLGYTDAALLDAVVDAFAAGDAASVFRLIDRVVETGIDPRRFVADLLERLRDLVILQAVPDAGVTGLLHAPEDQLALMLGQASRFGPAELARAADVVNAGLTEMRGATAPRLQLELICARVLSPAADADAERGTRARLDRLERRFAISTAGSTGPVSAPTAPPATAAVEAAAPVVTPAPVVGPAPVVTPAPAVIGGPGEAEATDSRDEAGAAAATDATVEVAGADLADNGAPDVAGPALAGPAVTVPAVAAAVPSASAPGNGLDLQAVRALWPDVLERVKVRRRVSWMLLFDKVQVLGLDGTTLTLGFPDAGSVKAFGASGHDEVLRLTLMDVVGADWRIDAVHQPGAPATSGAPATGAATAGASASGTATAGSTATGGPANGAGASEATGATAGGPSPTPPPTLSPRTSPSAASTPKATAPVATAAGRGPVPWTPPPPEPAADPGPASAHPPLGDDAPTADDADVDTDLAGAELIARELGGRVIKEIGKP